MKNAQKILLSLTLVLSSAAPAGAFSLLHHKAATTQYTTVKHKNFVQRHPVISAIGAAAVIHHFAKKH